MTIKGLIFDADDTLYATHDAAGKAELSSMRFFAAQKNLDAEELYREFLEIVGKVKKSRNPARRHRLHSYSILAKRHGLKDVEKAYRIFFDEVLRQITIMPDLVYALKKLSPYKKAIVSQDFREQITLKLKSLKLGRYFSTIITSDDARVMKPHRKYYQLAFRKLKARPRECVAIGDDYERDLEIPKSLGCKTVMYGFDRHADYCFLDYRKLPEIIDKINKK